MWATLRQPRFLALWAVAVLAAAGCVWAGVWQIHRYDWKHGSNDLLRHNNAAAVVPAADLLSTRREASKHLQFRKVSATGRYVARDQLLVRSREVNDSPAYLVLTPLRTNAGPMLLVVRGWVPVTGSATVAPRVPGPPAGEVRLTARIYPSEPAGGATSLPRGQIERINVPALRDRLGQPTYGGYAELIHESGTSRLAVLPGPDMSNPAGGAYELQHLAYVVQWFVFALIALALPVVLARIEARRDERPRPEIAAPVR